MIIRAIYDNGGKTLDRYTVYFSTYRQPKTVKHYDCLAMSERPFHPLGFGRHSSGQLGRHNGKRITFDQLPVDCQELVKRHIEPEIKGV